MNRFWSVSSNGFINWKGNWAGITKGWRGCANHDYWIDARDLATAEARAYWTTEHIPDKAWCSADAVQEFSHIVRRIFPDGGRDYTPADVVRQIQAYIGSK